MLYKEPSITPPARPTAQAFGAMFLSGVQKYEAAEAAPAAPIRDNLSTVTCLVLYLQTEVKL